MKLLDIKLSRRTDLISGVYIKEGINWLLIQDNPVDYILDGYSFINKMFVKSISNSFEEENFEHKVFKLKFKEENLKNLLNIKLDTHQELILFFSDERKLIEIELESNDYSIIGKVIKIYEKSFVLELLGTKCEFLREENFKYSSIRRINIDTDYLKSLENYLKAYPKKDKSL